MTSPMPRAHRWRSPMPFAARRDNPAQVFPEPGIGNGHALRILDGDPVPGRRPQYAEGHRDTMIPAWIYRSRKLLRARSHSHSIRQLLRLCSDRTKVLHDGVDAVALLDPELRRAGDLEIDGGGGSQTGQQWQLVDQGRDQLAANARASQLRWLHTNRADVFTGAGGVLLFLDAGAHAPQSGKESGAGRVQTDIGQNELALRCQGS